jgi:alpha-mannosidase
MAHTIYGARVHVDRGLVEERVTRELYERVLPLVERETSPLSITAGLTPDEQAPFEAGSMWGPPWGTTWFTFTGVVPEHWEGGRVEAVIDLGFRGDAAGFQCEGLVVDDAGRPVQGIHPRRTHHRIDAIPGPVTVRLEAASNPSFRQFAPSPLGLPETAGEAPLYRFRDAHLALVDSDAEALVHDLDVVDGLMRTMAPTDPRRPRFLRTLERALDACPDVERARGVLRPLLTMRATDSAHRVIAVGHAHIDTAWLWPIRETVRKCTRTFASAVRLMDEWPEYRFACSQAQQYAWIEERHPDLFERITAKVRGGQWIPVGGMWVEADMNLPSGESLARQIVSRAALVRVAVRVTLHRGVDPRRVRLPGIAAAALRSRRHAPVRHPEAVVEQAEPLPPPHVLVGGPRRHPRAHPLPAGRHLQRRDHPRRVAHGSSELRRAAWSDWSLMPFGHGDGGGGPTREMLERARRMADLDGAPRVEIGTPAEFFDARRAEILDGAPVPVWRGELYFETHRGTLTSQLRTKEGNRRCERLLREVELWAATLGRAGRRRPPVARGAHPAVPRHHPRLVDRLGARRRRAVHAAVIEALELAPHGSLLDRLVPATPHAHERGGHPRDEVIDRPGRARCGCRSCERNRAARTGGALTTRTITSSSPTAR